MPTTPSQHLDGLYLTSTTGAHVLLVGADEILDRCGVAAHTAGLAEHLAETAASGSVLAASPRPPLPCRGPAPVSPPAGLRLDLTGEKGGAAVVRVRRRPTEGDGIRRRTGDELGFLTGALTATLPHVPDVVLGVTPGLGCAVAAARIARRHRSPLVLIVHDLLSARPGGTGGRALTVADAAERRVLRAAAEVAVTSPELADRVYRLGVGPEHVHLLPHWAPDGAPPIDRTVARRALGWPIRPFTVVLSADGGVRPDLATVCSAAELLHGEARFVLVGGSSRRAAVPSQIPAPGALRRTGPLDDATHHRTLAAADLLLVAERPDATGLPLPGTLAHYLAAARPVLAAVPESGSVAGDLARGAGAGLVVPPGEPHLLAAAVRALILDETARREMARAAGRYALDRMGRAAVMGQLDTMLRAALGDAVIDLTTA